jgi:hypothetical protein
LSTISTGGGAAALAGEGFGDDDQGTLFQPINTALTVVPEPSTSLLLTFGLIGLAVRRQSLACQNRSLSDFL